MDAVIGIGGKLVRRLVVGVLICLDEVGVLLIVGRERGHEQHALGKGGVEALNGEQAVHAVGTHEGHVVSHVLGVLEQNGRRRVVDRRKDERDAGLLGLGELVGKARGRVVLKGLGIDDIKFGLLGLLGKGIGNTRAVRIAGVVEQGDLGVCILLGQKLGSTRAHGGVGKANLENRGLVLGDVEGRSRGRDHEHIVGDLARDSDGGTSRDGADERLHAPVAQGIEGVDSLLAVGDVILGLKREFEVLGREILGGKLGTLLGRNAIGCRGAGQRADDTDLEGLAVIGGAAVRATRRATSECGGAAERRSAGEKVPTAERAVDVEHGVPLFRWPRCGRLAVQGKPYGANVDSLLRESVCSERVSNVSAAFRGCRFVRLLLPGEHAPPVHARMHSTFKRFIHP